MVLATRCSALAVSDDAVREHAYLVSRGVRSFALVGDCEAIPCIMGEIRQQLDQLAMPYTRQGAIPFVVKWRDGEHMRADYGFASSPWLIDLWAWLTNADREAVPAVHRNRLRGLILGYG